MVRSLKAAGVRVPEGFATTAAAFREAIDAAGATAALRQALSGLDVSDTRALTRVWPALPRDRLRRRTGRGARAAHRRGLRASRGALRRPRERGGAQLRHRRGPARRQLRRPARHLPERERRGDAARRRAGAASPACSPTAPSRYRIDHGFDHLKVFLSVGVMKMVRSDLAASGVIFTLDTESGIRDVVFVTGACGLGENVVQGAVDPDEFYVHKPTYAQGFRAVLRRDAGREADAHGLCGHGRGGASHAQHAHAAGRARALLPQRRGGAGAGRLRRSRSRTTTASAPARPRRWTSSGPRTARTASSTSCRRARRRWPRGAPTCSSRSTVLDGQRRRCWRRAARSATASPAARLGWCTDGGPRGVPDRARCWWPTPRRRTGSRS